MNPDEPKSPDSARSDDDKNVLIDKFKELLTSTSIEAFITGVHSDKSRRIETQLMNTIFKLMKIELTDRENRDLLSRWFGFVGLSAQNIRHLEICSIVDFPTLVASSNNELRSLADRGRFGGDIKRKLLQSTIVLYSYNKEELRKTRDSMEDAPESSNAGPSEPGPSNYVANTSSSVPSLTVGGGSKMMQSASMNFGTSGSKSPKTNPRLAHVIPHKWRRSNKFRFTGDGNCHFCQRPLGFSFLNAWEKCRSCKWKVHTQCKGRIGDSCGLTPNHVRMIFNKLVEENNGGMWNDPQSAAPLPISRSMNENAFQYPDTAIDSSSSTNSSAPSTPAIIAGSSGTSGSNLNPLTAPYRSERKFLFPDAETHPMHNKLPILVISEGDDHTEPKIENGIESEGTIVANDSYERYEPQNNIAAEKFQKRAESGHTWERHTWNMSTIRGPNAQASWNDILIQYDTIKFDTPVKFCLGHGRFGDVFRGYHYGDVAVKILTMDHVRDESKKVEEFKLEVSAYKNTRHDNIALFLGYFINAQNQFGIVSNLVKGNQSLYTMLHLSREQLDLSTCRRLALQICQGVSYLHTKKILHKDLRTKNVLLEGKNKIVITDFGILSMKRLCYPKKKNAYLVPDFWTSYIAPELVTAIRCDYEHFYGEELPFSESSDVYAFGTIWFEMLTGMMPFGELDCHQILYLKGNGMKPSLPNISCTREMKDLLMKCWNPNPYDRPTFSDIYAKFTTLPRKQRINRSPSFPVIKSYESTF